jgi:SAM-dependent methyltransferase
MERRFSFDKVAELYQAARPDYPHELFDDVAAGLAAAGSILEIGAGSGKATEGFLRRRFSVVAIEPGEDLIRVAKERLAELGRVRFVPSTFEAWKPEKPSFDLVVAAQSIHWVPAEIAFPKAAATLRPGGRIAVFGNVPMQLPQPFREDLARIHLRHAGDAQSWLAEAWYLPSGPLPALIAQSVCFQPAVHKAYSWTRTYSSDSYIALLQTLSSYRMMATDARARLLADIASVIEERGGELELGYETHLYTATRL